MITENVSTLKINKLTQTQYERELAAGNIKSNEIYLTPSSSFEDGFSPIANVIQTETGATISITDKNGTTTADISNGEDGEIGGYYTPTMRQTSANGFTLGFQASKDDMPAIDSLDVTLPSGVSPRVSVENIEGGNRVNIVDASGLKTVDIMDGADGHTPIKGTDYWTESDKNEIIDGFKIIDGGDAYTDYTGDTGIKTAVKWTCLGDSITDLRTNRPNNYPYWINYRNPSITVQNLGIGGALICFDRDNTLSDGSPVNSLYTQAQSIAADTDIITVFGGVNDYNWSVPLGTFTTNLSGYPTTKLATAKGGKTVADGGGVPNGGTFYQGVYRLAKYLRETYPDKPIVWFTPMTFGVGNTEGKDVQNQYGNTIYQYMDAIKEVTGYFSIPCYDLGRLCNITPRIQAMQNKYYFDTLHPNAQGSLIISRIIEREIKKTLGEWGVNL